MATTATFAYGSVYGPAVETAKVDFDTRKFSYGSLYGPIVAADPDSPTTYLPNSASCTGYEMSDSGAPPDTLVADVETEYDATDKAEASDDDQDGVNSMAVNSGHRLKFVLTEATLTKLEIITKLETTGAGSINNAQLYIWDFTNSEWDLLDSRTDIDTVQEFIIHDAVYSGLTDYISSNTVYILLQRTGGGAVGFFYLNYAKLDVVGEAAPGGDIVLFRRRMEAA